MRILIDGYNLLHQTPYLTTDRSTDWLARARGRLLAALANHLPRHWQQKTCVVFDKSRPSIELDESYGEGILVRFAHQFDEADDLIEHLIYHSSNRRTLTVVSSDHRLHDFARRYKAKPIDSDQWFDQLVDGFYLSTNDSGPVTDSLDADENTTTARLPDNDVKDWLEAFRESKPATKKTSENITDPRKRSRRQLTDDDLNFE